MAWGPFNAGSGGAQSGGGTAKEIAYEDTLGISASNMQDALDKVLGNTLPKLTVTTTAGSALTITDGQSTITGTAHTIAKYHLSTCHFNQVCFDVKLIIEICWFFIIAGYIHNRKYNILIHHIPQGYTDVTKEFNARQFKPSKMITMVRNTHHIGFVKAYIY